MLSSQSAVTLQRQNRQIHNQQNLGHASSLNESNLNKELGQDKESGHTIFAPKESRSSAKSVKSCASRNSIQSVVSIMSPSSSRRMRRPQLRAREGVESDEFKTVNSYSSSIRRRSFTILRTGKSITAEGVNQFQEISPFQWQNSGKHNERDADESLPFGEWMESEYQKPTSDSVLAMQPGLSAQLRKNVLLESLVHKMEDFITFQMAESRRSQQELEASSGGTSKGSFRSRNNKFCCTFSKQLQQLQGKKQCKYYSLIVIHCNTENCFRLLTWLNRRETLSKLRDFNQIEIVNLPNLHLDLPVCRIEQFAPRLFQKVFYLLLKQIQVVQFELDEHKTILQIDVNIADTLHFESIIRIYVSELGKVEIYTQSAEQIRGDEGDYFQLRWRLLFKELCRFGILVDTL